MAKFKCNCQIVAMFLSSLTSKYKCAMRPWYLFSHEHNIFSKGPKYQCYALHVVQPSLRSMLTQPSLLFLFWTLGCAHLWLRSFYTLPPFCLDVARVRIDTRLSLPAQPQRSHSGAGKLRNEVSQIYWNTPMGDEVKWLLKDGSGRIFERYDNLLKPPHTQLVSPYRCK